MSEAVENLSTLKINYLTQEQYDAAVSSGIIQENELYLTPTSGEQSALPSGGLMGQVLAKSSNDNYAVAWSSIDAGMKVTVTKSGSTYSADKTFAEITNALNDNINVYVVYSNYIYFLNRIESSYVNFTYKNIDYNNGNTSQRIIFIYSDGSVGYSSGSISIPSLNEVANSLMLVIEKTTNNNTVSYSIDGLEAAGYPSQNFERYFYALYNRGSPSYYLQAKIYEKKTNYDPEAGYSETFDNNFELYDLADAWFDSKWDDDIDSYGYFPHFRFTRIYDDNGTKKLATLSVDAKDNASWNPLSSDVSDIYYSVSYSEEQLGGGATLVVTLTRSGSTVSSDKSPSQIYDAFLDGKQIYAKYANGDAIYPLYSCASNEAYFTNSYVDNSAISCSKIRVYKYTGQIRVESSGGNVSTVKRYTFGFLYDSSQDEYTYDGCLETGSPDSFFWASRAGNACLTVSYESTSGYPIKETAWVQKQSLEYEEIDGNSVPIGRAHFINLSIPTMMITDYEMVWDLEDGNFKELNVTKVPIGSSISGVSF